MNKHKPNTANSINLGSFRSIESLHDWIESYFITAFDELEFGANTPILLTDATKPEFGDFQVNGVMGVAKSLKKNPRELAALVIEKVKLLLQQTIKLLPNQYSVKEIFHLEIAGPGFINIKLNSVYLAHRLSKLQQTLFCPILNGKTVVVDMSSPNLAKEMHVGHLRSTIIGDAIARIYEYLGYKVIRQNHVGDWGTQFGMLIAYLEKTLDKYTLENLNTTDIQKSWSILDLKIDDLEEFYRSAKNQFDSDSEFANLARKYVVILQNWKDYGEQGALIYKYWVAFSITSLKHCKEVYEKLQVNLKENNVCGESYYNDLLPHIVKVLEETKKNQDEPLLTLSEGAKCIFLNSNDLDGGTETTPLIIQKQDGGYLYATTDLAAIDYRVHSLDADRIIYVVDARQSLHFKQIFWVAKKAGFTNKTKKPSLDLYDFEPYIDKADTILEHVAFGTMMGEDGKPFKTRTGGTVKLIDLIDEAVIRASVIVNARHPTWSDADKKTLANKLAIAAIKYADLSKNRNSDYIFSFDKMLAFDGNTAPYLLYAYTRICSVLSKALQDAPVSMTKIRNKNEETKFVISIAIEHKLALHLAKFMDVIQSAATECYPHYLCQYLYNLAGLFMKFYEECPIIKVESEAIQQSRLQMASLTANILKVGLDLLGIDVVEQM